GFTFLPGFLNLTETKYGAGLEQLDFSQETEQSRKAINAWVEKQTHDKIKDLLQKGDLSPLTRLVLTNAIYFKSAWQNKFWDGTKAEPFNPAAAQKVQAQMMHKHEDLAYFNGGSFQVVELPYKDHALSMVVLLPKEVF